MKTEVHTFGAAQELGSFGNVHAGLRSFAMMDEDVMGVKKTRVVDGKSDQCKTEMQSVCDLIEW